MVFSSIYFLAYFLPLFVIIYSFLPKKLNIKNTFILLASIFFYSWGGPKFIFAILGTTFVDFWLVRYMNKKETRSHRLLFLILSISVNFSLLFFFKYFNFFIDNLNGLYHLLNLGPGGIHVAKILLPIGISFYTFESITYSVDVYRRVHAPLKNFWEYQLYIIMFPKLIAGPIVRYHQISDQITGHLKDETAENRLMGFIQFCIGLSKKVLIANVMGQQADMIFHLNPESINTLAAWTGAIAYTFQIYFDFSGYSDMALGIGRFMGFRFPENFNNPYTSVSITDFWRRWHMTLGAWMKNYLYIPLGGNKVKTYRTYMNLTIVFLASGLWHGASWSFVFWGAYHGIFLVIERAFLLKIKEKIGKYPNIIITFIIVVIGWVFFREENIARAFRFTGRMFAFDFDGARAVVTNNDFSIMVFFAIFFSVFTLNKYTKKLHDKIFNSGLNKSSTALFTLIGVALYLLCLVIVSGSSFNPFIYFRF